MSNDYGDKPKGDFDPNRISRRTAIVTGKNSPPEVAKPAIVKKPRSPILGTIKDAVVNSHIWQRRNMRQETKTLDTLAEKTQAEGRLADDELNLTGKQINLYEKQTDKVAVEEDADDLIDHRKALRAVKRANKLDAVQQAGELAEHNHNKVVRPDKKKRGMSEEERLRQKYQEFARTGVSAGPAAKAAQNVIDDDIKKYGSFDDIPEDIKRNHRDMMLNARQEDQSKG